MTSLPSPSISGSVRIRRESVVIPTYQPLPPDLNPMFLENRVYQGSSGRVYPLPFYNRVSEEKQDRTWDAIYLENDFIEIMILPEIGGRIHAARDKSNGYDLFYRQSVIKPALVGLAGPWVSGGVEFNWPQHHRPATFMAVNVEFENHADGSKTVWLGDHDPMERMKGMHGVHLRPDSAAIELRMRAHNRTQQVKTFLWWANVATHVHEGYQSFFPPDVTCVADHAKRAMSRFPLCEGRYYGVNYATRARRGIPPYERPSAFLPPHAGGANPDGKIPSYAPNDLSWYANIPVPTSYMCIGSSEDFSGGYDHKRGAGFVQIANHHIAPGKKQWTWGNHAFGYAWDRNLTDSDGPYIELMLGAYTDNQPDFSFLQPGETKSWNIVWYPLRAIGPAQAANEEAALSLRVSGASAKLGVASSKRLPGAHITLLRRGVALRSWSHDLAPDHPFTASLRLPRGSSAIDFRMEVHAADGRRVVDYEPRTPSPAPLPPPATEPPPPAKVGGADELFLIGRHLSQYRHATRSPLPYWEEALRRDPGDSRCNHAIGAWHLQRGEFVLAESFLRRSVARITSLNPNPYDGEPFYDLGLTLDRLVRTDEAYDAFHKAVWNQAWQSAGYHALACIDCRRGAWATALDHLDRALRCNSDNLGPRNLRALVLRKLGREAEASSLLDETLNLDPLDWCARHLRGEVLRCDTQVRLDLCLDYARSGFLDLALGILADARPEPFSGTAPLIGYYQAWLEEKNGEPARAATARNAAASAPGDYCFPSRLEEIVILGEAIDKNPGDARAPYYLGNLLYDRRRYKEAITLWERSARLDPAWSIVWRNLGIAYFNVLHSAPAARRAYERALAANPSDPRLAYERDQLWKRTRRPARARLRELERLRSLVEQRDDAVIECCGLLNQTGEHARALEILEQRRFQPWEGGEGQALGQYVRTRLALGRKALHAGDAQSAFSHFSMALQPPDSLGEARHLLANHSDISFWLGEACLAAGRRRDARAWWSEAARTRGDFQDMSVKSYSDMTAFSARALQRLGRHAQAAALLRELARHARRLLHTPAKIDYFATSLPSLLLFNDDLQARQETTALFLLAQADAGLGRRAAARRRLATLLKRDPSHSGATDLLTEL